MVIPANAGIQDATPLLTPIPETAPTNLGKVRE